MNRRQFVRRSATVGGALLGRESFQFARRNLVPPTDTERPGRVLSRADGVAGEMAGVEGTVVNVDVRGRGAEEAFDVVVRRREYPTGTVLGSSVTERVDGLDSDHSETVTVTVPRAHRRPGTWFYEAFVRPPDEDDDEAYLCESVPLRWCDGTGAGTTTADRIADPHPSVDGERFSRRHTGNDYVLSYRWRDSEEVTWTADYRLRRSTHDAAVAADRGYTTTYEESLSSQVARDFAAVLQRRARPLSEAAADDGDVESTLASLDAGRRFDVLARFVQGFHYARDAETLDTYDYHRTVEETLADGVGDCKDLTYLLAGLVTASFDCETTLLFQTGHVLLGVDLHDVPTLPFEVESLSLADHEYLVLDPALDGAIDAYPDEPFVAAYSDGGWFYHDSGALRAGVDNVLRDWLVNLDVLPRLF